MVTSALIRIERVQTGIRIEKRLLKVLKALAEAKDMSVGDLIEGIVLHAFAGQAPFSPDTLRQIEQLKSVYRLELDASASHRLAEEVPVALASATAKSKAKAKP